MKLISFKSSYAVISSTSEEFRTIYSIEGKVTQKELTNMVMLYSSSTNQLIRTAVIDHNGNYSFTSLPKLSYFVIVRDKTKQYNAVIQDNIVPK